MKTPPGTLRSRSFTRFTMRVAFPHFGQSVDFEVSITFLRSAVFAILAIGKSPFGVLRLRLLWRGMGNLEETSVSPAFCPETTQEAFRYRNPEDNAATHKTTTVA